MLNVLEYIDFSAWVAIGVGVVATGIMYYIAYESKKEQKLKTQN